MGILTTLPACQCCPDIINKALRTHDIIGFYAQAVHRRRRCESTCLRGMHVRHFCVFLSTKPSERTYPKLLTPVPTRSLTDAHKRLIVLLAFLGRHL